MKINPQKRGWRRKAEKEIILNIFKKVHSKPDVPISDAAGHAAITSKVGMAFVFIIIKECKQDDMLHSYKRPKSCKNVLDTVDNFNKNAKK